MVWTTIVFLFLLLSVNTTVSIYSNFKSVLFFTEVGGEQVLRLALPPPNGAPMVGLQTVC